MAVWIDDRLPDQERYLALSFRARSCLVDVWCYAKRSKSDGVVKVERLHRASDAFTPEVMAELIEQRWWHRGGRGCGDDTCPKGIEGYIVLHDFTEHQESAHDETKRINASRSTKRKQAEARRRYMETHEPIKDETTGRIVGWRERE